MLVAIFMIIADNLFLLFGEFFFILPIYCFTKFRLDLHDNEFFFCIVSKVYKKERMYLIEGVKGIILTDILVVFTVKSTIVNTI